MATLLSNKFSKKFSFYLYSKIDMKNEVSVSELTPPNLSLVPLKKTKRQQQKIGL